MWIDLKTILYTFFQHFATNQWFINVDIQFFSLFFSPFIQLFN